MPAKQRRYAGELAKQIVCPNPPTFWGVATQKRVRKYCRDYKNHRRKVEQDMNQKLLKKMSLLMKHFEITDGSDWEALACASVPACARFQDRGGKGEGRPDERMARGKTVCAGEPERWNTPSALRILAANSPGDTMCQLTFGLPRLFILA
jgi:hypothetical protein